MADSDDPCDDVIGKNLTGWVKTNKKEIVPLSYARFEHG